MKLKPKSVSCKIIDGSPNICFSFKNQPLCAVQIAADKCRSVVEKHKDVELILKKVTKGRSLNANAYMWQLCEKIAEKLTVMHGETVVKEDIYRNAVRECGVFKYCEISERAADTVMTSWGRQGTGWIAERVDFSQTKGFVALNLYYGSSTYDTKQMSRLIDIVVSDAKSLGIETMTPDEIANLKSLWGTQK